jgi:acetyltransferase-like isoleucine patch superfamily enzyme
MKWPDAWLVLRGIPNTVRFNLAYFPLRTAIRIPVVVSHRVLFDHLGGTVELEGPVKRRMIKMGFGDVGSFDRPRSRSVWQVKGRVIFKGRAYLNQGTKVAVGPDATVTFGDGFVVSEAAIAAMCSVTFGRDVIIAWDTQIMDSDFHSLVDADERVLNPDEEIRVGDGVWIGARATLLRGAVVAAGSVVAAGAVVTRAFCEPHVLLAGVPAREVKHGVSWRMPPPGTAAATTIGGTGPGGSSGSN